MSSKARHIIIDLILFSDHYILPKVNGHGVPMFKMYSGNMVPEYYISYRQLKPYRDLMKRDKRGRMTLNLSKVRQLHGNSWIKKAYKRNAGTGKL